MKLSTRPPLIRLARIDQEIRTGKFPNASSLAQLLEVHPRTIHRDLDLMRDQFHAPLVYDSSRFGFYYQDPQFALPAIKISEGEFVALFLAERLLGQYRGTPFGSALDTLFQKLIAFLPEGTSLHLDQLAQAYSFQMPQTEGLELDLFQRLHQAVVQTRRLNFCTGRPIAIRPGGAKWILTTFSAPKGNGISWDIVISGRNP